MESINQSISELLYQSFSKPLWSLGPLLFVAYVKGIGKNIGSTVKGIGKNIVSTEKGIGKNIGSTIRLFADGCLIYRVSQEECARLRESVPYVKVYRYNPKHLCPKWNGYGDNGQRKVWSSGGSTQFTCQLTVLSMSVLECGVI